MLQLISLLLVAYSYFLIRTNLPHLPPRIPTHFSVTGSADGWGTPRSLWVLLGAQILTSAVTLIVPYVGRRYPGAVHFGTTSFSDYSLAQRARIVPLLKDMAGYMCMVMNLFFVWLLDQIIRAASQPTPHIQMFGPLALLLGGTLGVLLYYLSKIRRVTGAPDERGTPHELTP